MTKKLDLSLPVTLVKLKDIQKTSKFKFPAGAATILVYRTDKVNAVKKLIKDQLHSYQVKDIPKEAGQVFNFQAKKGALLLVCLPVQSFEYSDHEGLLDPSNYSMARDLIGAGVLELEQKYSSIHMNLFELEYDEMLGSLLGLELGAYDYKKLKSELSFSSQYSGALEKDTLKDVLKNAKDIGQGLNIARFLVDVPPNLKRPDTYANGIKDLFSNKPGMTVTVWNEARLKREKMGCLLGVGQGSVQTARLVHLRYRPKKSKDISPVAFIGKGITFDTGGVNLKPGGSMRLMKKDMGGSACLVGLAQWVVKSKLEVPCDFYFALAENSVDAESFRPSDVLTARNGMTVEIDNTDAEGRLVMADALALASEAKGADKPQFLIDVATLTGAIKVGLGSDIGGLFSNDDDLAFLLQNCGQMAGDPLWRMPLMNSQREKLNSEVADISNSASGFGGAIRAAMFLKEFTGGLPWAHLDIFAWNDGRKSFYRGAGGSGQAVQCLAQFLSQL